MCVGMCMCLYMYMHVYVYLYVYVCIYVPAHTHTIIRFDERRLIGSNGLSYPDGWHISTYAQRKCCSDTTVDTFMSLECRL